MLIVAVLVYAAAMVLANLSVAHFGPASAPINAFVLIGLDLALRNWLALKLNRWQMVAMIAFAAALSYGLNPASGRIAIASLAAFSLAALSDWATFSTLSGQWIRRCIGGVTVGAAVDSIAFSGIAFDLPLSVLAGIAGSMFMAKVLGGSLWAFAIKWIAGSTTSGEAPR